LADRRLHLWVLQQPLVQLRLRRRGHAFPGQAL
jgi:hypothetical protein